MAKITSFLTCGPLPAMVFRASEAPAHAAAGPDFHLVPAATASIGSAMAQSLVIDDGAAPTSFGTGVGERKLRTAAGPSGLRPGLSSPSSPLPAMAPA
jgi:hypothetical protein